MAAGNVEISEIGFHSSEAAGVIAGSSCGDHNQISGSGKLLMSKPISSLLSLACDDNDNDDDDDDDEEADLWVHLQFQ